MARSLKKGPYVDERLLRRVMALRELSGAEREKAVIKTYARNSVITPEMIGAAFDVHIGKGFTRVKVRDEMVGHHIGEFAPTRKFVRHGGKLQKEIEAKQATTSAAPAAPAAPQKQS